MPRLQVPDQGDVPRASPSPARIWRYGSNAAWGAGQAEIVLALDLTAADARWAPIARFAAPLTVILQLGEWGNWASLPDWLLRYPGGGGADAGAGPARAGGGGL